MDKEHTIGDGPIEAAYHKQMQDLARVLDTMLNPEYNKVLPGLPKSERQTGFVLMVFPFYDNKGRCNYISNADRSDVVKLLKEQLKRFENS